MVQALCLAGEVDNVSVPMQIAAFAFVPADAVAAVDFVFSRNLKRHNAGELPSNWRNLCRRDAAPTSCQRATAGDGTIIAVQGAALHVWSRALMVHSSHRNGRMRYGPSSSWERPHDGGSASSDPA